MGGGLKLNAVPTAGSVMLSAQNTLVYAYDGRQYPLFLLGEGAYGAVYGCPALRVAIKRSYVEVVVFDDKPEGSDGLLEQMTQKWGCNEYVDDRAKRIKRFLGNDKAYLRELMALRLLYGDQCRFAIDDSSRYIMRKVLGKHCVCFVYPYSMEYPYDPAKTQNLRQFLDSNLDLNINVFVKVLGNAAAALVQAYGQIDARAGHHFGEIVHRDIRLENFVVCPSTLMVDGIDWGESAFGGQVLKVSLAMRSYHCADEVFSKGYHPDRASDVYEFCIMAICMLLKWALGQARVAGVIEYASAQQLMSYIYSAQTSSRVVHGIDRVRAQLIRWAPFGAAKPLMDFLIQQIASKPERRAPLAEVAAYFGRPPASSLDIQAAPRPIAAAARPAYSVGLSARMAKETDLLLGKGVSTEEAAAEETGAPRGWRFWPFCC